MQCDIGKALYANQMLYAERIAASNVVELQAAHGQAALVFLKAFRSHCDICSQCETHPDMAPATVKAFT